jgi:hypothetical protein
MSSRDANARSIDTEPDSQRRAGSLLEISIPFRSRRRIAGRLTILSGQEKHERDTGHCRQDRYWNSKTRVVPETDLDKPARRFDHDNVRDRADNRPVSSQNVVASASTFHMSSSTANRPIHFPATSTKGTFEKTLEPAAENQVKFQACVDTIVPKIGWR